LYQQIKDFYDRNNLAYHNYDHVENCLVEFKELISLKDAILNEQMVKIYEYAFLFHDIIYIPFSQENEKRSADFAFRYLTEKLGETNLVADAVSNLILNPTTLFNRVDYVPFIYSWKDYKSKYMNKIHEEFKCFIESGYCKFSYSDFLHGRSCFLQRELEIIKNYFPNEVHKQNAESNISKEIEFCKIKF
jgi:predicted metal-dependent HD superfamily phosphohydrolase